MSLIAALITVSDPGCVNNTTYTLDSELEDEIELFVLAFSGLEVGFSFIVRHLFYLSDTYFNSQ